MPLVTPPETKEYTVVKGDSFYKIAKANGLSVDAIARANPRSIHPNADRAKAANSCHPPAPVPSAIEKASAQASATANYTVYVVKRGDTLAKIARNHGTSVKAIRSANGLATDRLCREKLKLPEAPQQTKPAETRPAKLS